MTLAGTGQFLWIKRDRLLPQWRKAWQIQLGDYRVEAWNHSDQGDEVRISLGRGVRLRVADWKLALGGADATGTRIYGIGSDINGDRVPDLIVSGFSGGAHCCSTHHIYSLGPDNITFIARVEGQHGGVEYADLDGDGSLELQLRDWTFAYWNTCFATSPAPAVILRFHGETLKLAPELMWKPPPSEAELALRIESLLAAANSSELEFATQPAVNYWETILEYIYTGHEQIAWRFAHAAWPAKLPGRDQFLRDFKDQLAYSPYWPEVRLVSTVRPDELPSH